MNNFQKKSVTRKDVAAHAGVSVATVSYVLGNTPGVKISTRTREKVWQAARELNYHPSYIGTALTARKSFNIGAVFKSFHHLNYSFYREILTGAGIAMEAENHHMLLLFRNSCDQLTDLMRSGRADGVLVIQSDPDFSQIKSLAENRIPVVIINSIPPPDLITERSALVMPDYVGMMREVISGFVRNNRKNILLVNKSSWANINLNRAFFAGCREFASAGVQGRFMERPENTEFASFLREAVRNKTLPDAMFINRFEYAETACQVLRESGIEPGRDIEIATATPDAPAAPLRGPFTLYIHNGAKIGEAAWELMKMIFARQNQPLEYRAIPFLKQEIN